MSSRRYLRKKLLKRLLSKNLLEMYHGLYDISVKYGEGYLKVMAKVHKNNEQNL